MRAHSALQALLLVILGFGLAGCTSTEPTPATDGASLTDRSSDSPRAGDSVWKDLPRPDARPDSLPSPDAGRGDAASCAALPAEVRGLFASLAMPGASNTPSPGTGTSHYEIVAKQAMLRLAPCVSYTPQFKVVAYSAPGQVPATTTLILSVDAFYHLSGASLDQFAKEVATFINTLHATASKAPLLVANIPKQMVINKTQPAAFNAAIATAVGAFPSYQAVDIDAAFDKLLAGKVRYNGVILGPLDVLIDPVHVNALGHKLVADLFILRLNEVYPDLKLPAVGVLELLP